uniref:Tudor domain-containing protein n=1 Tax=Steinernema glaseri TaxID=37863 RepID=A0A1I8ABF6_9BILA
MHPISLLILVVSAYRRRCTLLFQAFVYYGELVRYSLIPFAVDKAHRTLWDEVSERAMCAQHALRSQKIAFGVVKMANGSFYCAVYSNIEGFMIKTNPDLEVFLLDKRAPLSCQEQSWDEANFSGESSSEKEGIGHLVLSFFEGPRVIEDEEMSRQLEELVYLFPLVFPNHELSVSAVYRRQYEPTFLLCFDQLPVTTPLPALKSPFTATGTYEWMGKRAS